MASDNLSLSEQLEQIKASLAVIMQPGIYELRIPKTRRGTISGYFDNPESLAKIAAQYSGEETALYLTLNPVDPALLARASNRAKVHAENTTSDNDIVKRCWLLIDLNAIRQTGISSTESEHQAAIDRAYKLAEWLELQGISKDSIVIADSGNGAHVLVRIDLPNDKPSTILCQNILKALDLVFTDKVVLVDQTTYNAARISKIYGTLVMKGDNTQDRPHRYGKLLQVPENIIPADTATLQRIADGAPKQPEPEYHGGDGRVVDIEKYLTQHNFEYRVSDYEGGKKYVLKQCPLGEHEHHYGEAVVIQFASGAPCFKCSHNTCVRNDWQALRDKYPINDAYISTHKRVYTNVTKNSTHERDKNVTDFVTGEAKASLENVTDKKVTLSDRITDWVKGTTGWFATDELDKDLGLNYARDKDNRRQIMLRLKEQGIIESHPRINKQFRYVNTKVTSLNFKTATDTGILPFKWPFEIERLVHLYPGNLICIAGATGAGKTAIILNIIYINQNKFPIYYFCSEMLDVELKSRLKEFPAIDIEDWQFEAKERSSDFADVIVPDCINIHCCPN